MKRSSRSLVLVAALASLSTGYSPAAPVVGVNADQRALSEALAAQISETSRSPSLSNKAKQEIASGAIQAALSAALAGVADWDTLVSTATYIAVQSIRTAPEFKETIIQAVVTTPRIAAKPELAKAIEDAIRRELTSEPEIAEPSVSQPARASARPIMDFSGSRAEAVVSPALFRPNPTPTPTPVPTPTKS